MQSLAAQPRLPKHLDNLPSRRQFLPNGESKSLANDRPAKATRTEHRPASSSQGLRYHNRWDRCHTDGIDSSHGRGRGGIQSITDGLAVGFLKLLEEVTRREKRLPLAVPIAERDQVYLDSGTTCSVPL